jgi:uncharacterized protein (TIGR04552 family)
MLSPSLPPPSAFKSLGDFSLADLEALRLLLRGGSVIDWHRLNFETPEQVREFIRAQEMDLEDPADRARSEAVKNEAISYLRRNFDFPIPRPVAEADLGRLLELASSKGHRQLCACTILKLMHIIHHIEARELLFMLPTSDEEVFHLVEQKVYRVIGGMLAQGFPIVEFIGGRKHKDSLYTKLLSKPEVTAAQIYDKLRFRVVTRTPDDILPTLDFLTRHLFPFSYVIPGESKNTLLHFRSYCEGHPRLRGLLPRLQLSPELEDQQDSLLDNQFSARSYKVVHFVVDMPVRMPDEMLAAAPPAAWALGRVIFVQSEIQILDQETDHRNELGAASHRAYKERQMEAVTRRLKLGMEEEAQTGRKKRGNGPPRG